MLEREAHVATEHGGVQREDRATLRPGVRRKALGLVLGSRRVVRSRFIRSVPTGLHHIARHDEGPDRDFPRLELLGAHEEHSRAWRHCHDADAQAIAAGFQARGNHPGVRGALDQRIFAQGPRAERDAIRDVELEAEILNRFGDDRVQLARPLRERGFVFRLGSSKLGDLVRRADGNHGGKKHDVVLAGLSQNRERRDRSRGEEGREARTGDCHFASLRQNMTVALIQASMEWESSTLKRRPGVLIVGR